MKSITPCLWFDDQAEAAAESYTRLFPDSRVTAVARYPESFDNPSGKPPGSVMTVELELAGLPFTLLNGGPQFTINPSISFFVHTDGVEETDSIFTALADGGSILMPLQAYPWSQRFGWVQDRFGVSWQVILGRRDGVRQKIVPCLMFTGAQHGRAEEAMRTFTALFDHSRVGDVARYTADEGPEGTVKHGRFVLAGQDFVAMDSHFEHRFGFDEGVSLQVMCEDQAEVDRYWAALSEGGEEGPCGWLEDRFGLSWQVAPTAFVELLKEGDAAANERAFQAMLDMKKLDIAALRAAHEG
ncbi:MAG TPA: VOC family protein [Thermoanaerobaculia bacterium]|nr:VOC family protein [Thermoanaerobaculia bacterium]